MRAQAPIAYVPQLDATLITRHADIVLNEKKISVFSSDQPQGLMAKLMGENLMRKDGKAHMVERRAVYPSMSPRTVREVWSSEFRAQTDRLLDAITDTTEADLFWRYAMPVSANALRSMTGLTNMSVEEMNRTSQGMIDGCANYTGDLEIEARCNDCTASIDISRQAPILLLLISEASRIGCPVIAKLGGGDTYDISSLWMVLHSAEAIR
ncbi:hypothetical protein OAR36_08395 [Pseudomonadales bacterium]|nr:hypothetical protein [Pseudomonadales bacterium]